MFANTNNKEAEESSILSWVPDWQQSIQQSFAWLHDETSDLLFSASKGLTFNPVTIPTGEVLTKEEERVLTLREYFVDEIEEGARSGKEVHATGMPANQFLMKHTVIILRRPAECAS